MSRVFSELQVFGWKQEQENILLATMLTGDRALLVSAPGAAKTLLPQKIAKALNLTFAPFDLNAVAFDDIIGVMDIPAMQKGELKYISAPSTIWGKDFVTYEEINRCKSAIQGKVLEHLRSGSIMGMDTGTKWCWANMNPIGNSGTNKLTPAIVDRFTFFVWAPDLLDMENEDRARIANVMTGADAPALTRWLKAAGVDESVISRTQDTTDYKKAGEILQRVLSKASQIWVDLESEYTNLSDFLSVFSSALYQNILDSNDTEKPEPVRLSGRRIAMIRRAILSYRAVELALAAELDVYPTSMKNAIQVAINAAIPVGINEEDGNQTGMRKYVNQAIRESYMIMDAGSADELRLQTELFTSRDPLVRARILLEGKIKSEEILNTGWQRITNMNQKSADLLAFVAVNIDAKLRAEGGTPILPSNVLDAMKTRITGEHVMPELPRLPGQLMSNLKDINEIIDESHTRDPIEGIIAVDAVHEVVTHEPDCTFVRLRTRIKEKQAEYRDILAKAVAK